MDMNLASSILAAMGEGILDSKSTFDVEELVASVIITQTIYGVVSVYRIPRYILDSPDPIVAASIYKIENAMYMARKESALMIMKQSSLANWQAELRELHGKLVA